MRKFIFLFVLVVSLVSCIEDEGNYDYTEIKEIEINGLEDSYRFLLQETQTLSPEITTDIDLSELSYCWRIGIDTLSTEKVFSYVFTKMVSSTDPLTFEVIHDATNVRYTKRIDISIVSPFQSGWLIFANVEGKPQLNFQSYEDKEDYFPNIYKGLNNEALSGTATEVKQLIYMDGLTSTYYDRVSLICTGGKSPELDGSSLLRQKFYEDEFKAGDLNLEAISSEYYSDDNALLIISNGKAYVKTPGQLGSPDDAYYEYPLDGDDEDYQLARNYTKGYSGYNSGDYYLAVDQLNNRYVSFQRSSLSTKIASLTIDNDNSISTIDPENLEGSSVWMGQTYNGYAVSILKTEAGKYILHFLAGSWNNIWTLLSSYEIPDGVINETSCFTTHKKNPYLMIGTGNKLMALNLEALSGSEAISDICTYEAPITAMHYSNSVDEFGIAIQTNTSSSSLLIIDPSLTAKGEIIKRYDNITGEIASIWRKEL